METSGFYNEILLDHNSHPMHKEKIKAVSRVHEGVNPSCGDDITLELNMDGDVITDGGFTGSGCAISQASTDIMLDMIIGKTKAEALELAELFDRMIKGEASDSDIERLDEAGALKDVSHMPARVKCAMLGWRTLRQMLQEK